MVELHPAAEAEMLAAASWYEERREGLGERFLDEVEAAGARVERAPFEGALWARRDVPVVVRRAHLHGFPYALVYVTEPRLVVLAVAHEKQRPEYWRARAPT